MPCRASTQSLIAMPSMAVLEYGPIIRTLSPGEAFGELALLQPQCLRTATVIAKGSTAQDESISISQDGTSWLNSTVLSPDEQLTSWGEEKVSLIKLTRQLFDESVTSMQVSQLETRLNFLMKFNVCISKNCLWGLVRKWQVMQRFDSVDTLSFGTAFCDHLWMGCRCSSLSSVIV